MQMPAGLRSTELVVLVTATVVWDTPLDCHFSAWSRPKPAPDPLPGPSVASGVIPTKGGRNGVLQPPAGRAPQGRWRSSPWKRCNHAPPRSRGQGAPRTARCIKTRNVRRRLRTYRPVREHPAPLGALRPPGRGLPPGQHLAGQGAPRTARCIKTGHATSHTGAALVREHPAPLGALRHRGRRGRFPFRFLSGSTPHR